MENTSKIVCGLTHIDLGWKKTRQEMEEVFENYVLKVLDLCDQYPDFTYMLEQAYHYRGLKKRRPDLFQRVVALVQSGRLAFMTPVASLMETNFPCGESFVRNIQLGRRFIESEFGVKVTNCSLIDTFGFPPQLPQVLRQMGYPRLFANRLGGCHTQDVMNAVGLDGTRILLAGSDELAYSVNPGHVNFKYFLDYTAHQSLFSDIEKNDTPVQIVIPYSENEVPPCRLLPENVEKSNGKYHFGFLDEFFDALEASGETFPEVSADLNPEFTGTFSLRHKLRLANRCAEGMLLEAEKTAALYNADVKDEIETCWWKLAFAQFHDVLSGSHPTEVYEDCLAHLENVRDTSLSVIRKCVCEATLVNQGTYVIWNGLPYPRKERVSLSLPQGWVGVSKALLDGKEVPVAQDEDGNVVLKTELRAMTAHALRLEQGVWSQKPMEALNDVMENEWIRVEFDARSMIARLVYKPTGAVLMKDVHDLLVFQKDEGNFQFERPAHSEISSAIGHYVRRLYRHNGVGHAEFNGAIDDPNGEPIRYTLVITLADDEPVLGIKVNVDWRSSAARLRLKINTCLDSSVNTYEVPFGATQRKPYVCRFNSHGEWPAQRYVCMEEKSANRGIALINCGSAGVESADGVLYTTLLRAPVAEYAGMISDGTSSDHGEHTFSFLLAPYDGCWQDSDIPSWAERFNNRPLAFEGLLCETSENVTLEGKGIILSAILSTQSGDTAVRVYETCGRESTLVLKLPENERVWLSDLNQERGDELKVADGRVTLPMKPFEIKTIVYGK